MNKAIELNNVIKKYKRGTEEVHAIDGVNLSIEEGEFLSIVGPSGSGKTTLLNLIGCVDKPTSGSVKLDTIEVKSLKDRELTKIRAKIIGFVFQQFFLLPTLTALENVELPTLFTPLETVEQPKRKKRFLTGFTRKVTNNSRARELLTLVGLENRGNHLPSQLSGGEMQRVAIARALINEPKILLADEPTGNLDSQNAQIIMDTFRRLNKNGLTIIVVTHNIELGQSAKRMVRLKDGKISERAFR